jgi:hypothetical protein
MNIQSSDIVFCIAGNMKPSAWIHKCRIPTLQHVVSINQTLPKSIQSIACIATIALRVISKLNIETARFSKLSDSQLHETTINSTEWHWTYLIHLGKPLLTLTNHRKTSCRNTQSQQENSKKTRPIGSNIVARILSKWNKETSQSTQSLQM